MKQTLIALALAAAGASAFAQGATPAGLWRTIDDDGKTEKSQVRISESGGVYTAKVEKINDPAKQAEKCVNCTGAAKDQPILGLTILWDVKQDGDDATTFAGGTILDPTNGKTYKVRLRPLDGGRKLQVRGYLGPFYRTQEWIRAE
jgi:uncharacterized protein (DUF2147 family)